MSSEPEDSATRYLRSRLAEIPSLFARLVLVAELGRPGSRVRTLIYGTSGSVSVETDVISDISSQLFREWLALPTKRKSEDMKVYLNSLGHSQPQDCTVFLDFAKQLIPEDASPAEIEFFLGTVRFITDLLKAQKRLQ